MSVRTVRSDRSDATRRRILDTAERLFAEYGVASVSNRQISEAAGQGNNTAVGYHFGTKVHLVRAIVRRHTDDIERRRLDMVARTPSSPTPRDWVMCLVCPLADHLDSLGSPTWFARFSAQVMTDPALREILYEETLTSPSLLHTLDGLQQCLPNLPVEVHLERSDMTRQLMVHMFAERERALAEMSTTPRASWRATAEGLADAIVGLWSAPVTARP
ncbi:TetR/AcrR family transcriptional regulator [Saccharomonospora sp.]|uniref:TetR/AcrR family transcriptional regulator n=1 Tax=Saccharomonospora sp. TaxID=33913 RepID=UPI00262FA5BE|nr:TetR/AcrR family transcriptional regulator [Saccharomonospora sp.]